MKKYFVDDTIYFVRTKGSGPILLFAHGFPLDGRLFEPVIDKLASKFYCVVPDLRGLGQTSLGANGRNSHGVPRVKMGRFADDLAILGSEVACERGCKGAKVFVCGLSMGGYIMLEFVRRRPQLFAGGIFCCSNANADTDGNALSRTYLADTIDSYAIRTLADNMVPSLTAPETPKDNPDVVATLRTIITSQKPQGVAAALRGMAVRRDLTDKLSKIEAPILVLGGESDVISPVELLDSIADAIPNSSRATIPGSGHVPPLENPDAFADAILEWYGRTFE